jgi:hypothetical protein
VIIGGFLHCYVQATSKQATAFGFDYGSMRDDSDNPSLHSLWGASIESLLSYEFSMLE